MCEPKVSAGVAIGTAIVAVLPVLAAGTAAAAVAWVIFTYWPLVVAIGLVSAALTRALVKHLLAHHTVIYWRGHPETYRAYVAPVAGIPTSANAVRQSHLEAIEGRVVPAIEAPKVALPRGWSATARHTVKARKQWEAQTWNS